MQSLAALSPDVEDGDGAGRGVVGPGRRWLVEVGGGSAGVEVVGEPGAIAGVSPTTTWLSPPPCRCKRLWWLAWAGGGERTQRWAGVHTIAVRTLPIRHCGQVLDDDNPTPTMNGMTNQAQDLLRAALELPVTDRADVAAELLASLDERTEADQQAVNEAWAREIEHRAQRVLTGNSAGETWDRVQARLAERLTQP
jgi:hypothetical protein